MTNKIGVILIVDDALENIRILKEILKNEYKVISTTQGTETLALALQEKPDLILLDIIMPHLSGYQICQQLKANALTANIPVMFITGQAGMDAELKGLEVGAIDYVTKPINPRVVRMRIRNLIALKNTHDSLLQIAVTDGLTDLSNRRYFDEVLQIETNHLARLQQPLSLILLDVDHFKKFNDQYGHVQGDYCLQQIAQVIKNCLPRDIDIAARYGGEEFACILPNMAQDSARTVAEGIRNAVEMLHIPHQASETTDHVTISLGGVTVFCTATTLPNAILKSADAQLYHAKRKGRNQVCFTTGLETNLSL